MVSKLKDIANILKGKDQITSRTENLEEHMVKGSVVESLNL